LASFFLLALTLPQAGKARGGTEFERLRLLLARNFNSLEKARFGFALGVGG
jgi:hypothetical protein